MPTVHILGQVCGGHSQLLSQAFVQSSKRLFLCISNQVQHSEFYATSYFYFPTFQMEIMYFAFILQLVTSYFSDFTCKYMISLQNMMILL